MCWLITKNAGVKVSDKSFNKNSRNSEIYRLRCVYTNRYTLTLNSTTHVLTSFYGHLCTDLRTFLHHISKIFKRHFLQYLSQNY